MAIGIRASISKGKVTQNDIITVLPFGNLISQIKVKGTNVKEAFEHSLGSPTETKDGKTTITKWRFLTSFEINTCLL